MTPNPKRRARPNAVSAEELASLSHEFRTPLNGVLGMARLLEGTRLTAEQRAYVGALRESGEHLLSLVNDVLDFARLGAGKVELRRAPMDVEDLLRSVCELLSPRAQEKGLEIAWAAPAGIGRIVADEGRLRQILLNFAGNAVKFTETGGALLSVEARPGGRLRFLVEDTGPGVAPKARTRIFEAFAQVDPAHATQFGGAGLGLAIARSLASAMEGEVGVGAAAGGGAAFWFEAAFEPVPESAPAATLSGRTVGLASPNPVVREAARRQLEACGARVLVAETAEELTARTGPEDVLLLDHALCEGARTLRRPAGRTSLVLLDLGQRDRIARYRQAGFAGYLVKPLRRSSLSERVLAAAGAGPTGRIEFDDERAAPAIAPGARVLLVEDNPVNALLAKALLTREGCVVAHVAGGQAALETADLASFDLVLMDMRMPGLSGVDTARALRKAGVSTPIVALTANAFEDDRHACLAAGMDDFLVKPLSPAALRAALARWTRPGWTGRPERARAG
jgi:CheY-like chemotaxis protein